MTVFRNVQGRNHIPALLATWRICRASAGLVALLCLAAPWLAAKRFPDLRDSIARGGWHIFLGGFGIRPRVSGEVQSGALFIANHVSWIDIAILAKLTGAGFVAKHEVRRWPLIGLLASQLGCVFIERRKKMTVRTQAQAIVGELLTGRGLVLFPEGTTSDGSGLLSFHSSLLAPVGEIDKVQVQPVGIAYRNHDGSHLNADDRRTVAWIGSDALLPHAVKLAKRTDLVAEIWFGPPAHFACRKEAAAYCGKAIGAWLSGDQAAALNREA